MSKYDPAVTLRTADNHVDIVYDGGLDAWKLTYLSKDRPAELYGTLAIAIARLVVIEEQDYAGQILAPAVDWMIEDMAHEPGDRYLWMTALEHHWPNQWHYDTQVGVYWITPALSHFHVGVDNTLRGDGHIQAIAYRRLSDEQPSMVSSTELIHPSVTGEMKFSPELVEMIAKGLRVWNTAVQCWLDGQDDENEIGDE